MLKAFVILVKYPNFTIYKVDIYIREKFKVCLANLLSLLLIEIFKSVIFHNFIISAHSIRS